MDVMDGVDGVAASRGCPRLPKSWEMAAERRWACLRWGLLALSWEAEFGEGIIGRVGISMPVYCLEWVLTADCDFWFVEGTKSGRRGKLNSGIAKVEVSAMMKMLFFFFCFNKWT